MLMATHHSLMAGMVVTADWAALLAAAVQRVWAALVARRALMAHLATAATVAMAAQVILLSHWAT